MDDVELLDAWRSGDDTAGSALFGKYFESIRRFFAHKTDAEVEDLVQSTFERCVRGTEKLRRAEAFRGYLFGIAHNVLLEHYRGRRREGHIDFTVRSMVDLTGRPSAKLAHADDRTR
ncbi:MAG: RNA polymerase subunit sigma-70, partial [Deltaproteobacteria bacterium]|nr:RNA polymerase subunit sigma-70 [Deltaproteobacteria bacterium]